MQLLPGAVLASYLALIQSLNELDAWQLANTPWHGRPEARMLIATYLMGRSDLDCDELISSPLHQPCCGLPAGGKGATILAVWKRTPSGNLRTACSTGGDPGTHASGLD